MEEGNDFAVSAAVDTGGGELLPPARSGAALEWLPMPSFLQGADWLYSANPPCLQLRAGGL